MPSKTHEAYQQQIRKWFLDHAHEPDIRPQLVLYAKAAQILWNLDLGAARPVLEKCYAKNPRGGDPWNCIVMLRLLLLLLLDETPGINAWVDKLRASRVLRALGGLNPNSKKTPGVGTFYDFLHRLHDGPIRKTCEHIERPSENERRRAKTPRRLLRREHKTAKAKGKQKRRDERGPKEKEAAELRSATAKLVADLEAAAELEQPEDLLNRMATILLDVGVLVSAELGLLGDIDRLDVGGDGSKMETGANRHGRRACEHKWNERCDCPKLYSDPDAQWGWDSHREQWFFGHHFYELSTSSQGHDLPLAISLFPGNCSDFTASLQTFENLRKLMNARLGTWTPEWFIADAGHDAEPIYRYLHGHGIKTVIPLKAPARATHPLRPDTRLSPRAVPMCQAGAEMTHWGSAGPGRVNFLCPVRAKTLERCPLAPDEQPDWHCRPNQPYGPTITVKTDHNPRLFPALPRNNPRYQELYNLRSGCERSNSVKKETFKLEAARHRRSSFWLIRLHLIAILQHARTWVADEDPNAFVDFLLGGEEERADMAA